MKRLTVICNDLYDIASRLKEIDQDYFVVYNHEMARYEVHNHRQKGNTFCLSVPYGILDSRTVELVRRTRVGRADQLLAEISKANETAERNATANALEKAGEILFGG